MFDTVGDAGIHKGHSPMESHTWIHQWWSTSGELHQCIQWMQCAYNRCSLRWFTKRDPIYPTPPLGQDMTQGQFFKRSLTGLNSESSFSKTSCLTKAEEPSLPCYLSIAGGRIIGFIPFPRVLVLCEMQSVLSRNWTRIAVSISCDDNHYTITPLSEMNDRDG